MAGDAMPTVFAEVSSVGYPASTEKTQPWKQWVELVDEKTEQAFVVEIPKQCEWGSNGLGGY